MTALAAGAQAAPRTAYFLDGYTYRHELNAAFSGEHNYFAIPFLGNYDIALFSNVGVNTFLYPTPAGSPYKLTTFMSPNVSADEFLGRLADVNHVNANFDMTLLSTGFRAFKGFNTISVGLHTDVGASLPKDLFRFMKLMQDGGHEYNFKDLKLDATAMAEISLGHSHKINSKLDVGAKVKILLGLGSASAHIRNMNVRMADDAWTVSADGYLEMSAGSGLYVPTKQEAGVDYDLPEQADLIEWNDIDYKNFGLAGFGLGFDLGATYQLLPDLQLSAAVNDLGFVNWKNAVKGHTGTEWRFDGFQNIAVDKDQPNYEDNKLDQQLDNMWDDLEDLINIHREEISALYTKALRATIHLGAEYKMPFYNRLTGGFLFSQYIAGCSSWTEGRFYATVKPVKWFDATINYGASTYGSSMGWMINFHPKGFNFFVGSDHQFFKVTPQFVPVGHASASINLGFNVTFGS
ncbi:MAG: hypothetical protein K2F79_03685 [Muribaculaceae bacterium]|nr:hypothetical protein [Muribaculaceae bacterium]